MIAPQRKPPPLFVALFGPMEVQLHGRPLPHLHSHKSLWILALLILNHDRGVQRDWLAGTLWPDSSQEQALSNLRLNLYNLRKALGDQKGRLLSPNQQTLRLDLAGAQVDLLTFDAALKRGDRLALQEAVALYRGPLLQGCTEEWMLPARAQREQSYLSALEGLSQHAREQGDPSSAVSFLRLLVAADPHRESACRALMQALWEAGDRAAVQQVYRTLRLRLREDLQADPTPETQDLYALLAQQQPQPSLPVRPAPEPTGPPRRLPVPLSSLIGREQEIQEVCYQTGKSRLVTLIGAGGMGKTRLAIATAEAIAERFPDGVWFVDLAPLSDRTMVAQATAKALGLHEEPGHTIEETLEETLSKRSILLVMDNCEHLLEGVAHLTQRLLTGSPGLRVISTSRQPLGLPGEQVYQVPSLMLPPQSGRWPADPSTREKDPGYLLDYAAIRLFIERAVQTAPDFRLHARNATAIEGICRRLDGIPLAIEMAAARVRSLSAPEIQARLDDRFGLLRSGSRAALPRQQTLEAALDWSYDLLNAVERTLLCRLSVFAGGWTLEAADYVCSDFGFWILDFGLSSVLPDGTASGSQGDQRNESSVHQPTPNQSSAIQNPKSKIQNRNESSAIQNPKSKIQNQEVLDLLASLVDKSLVVYEAGVEEGRYRLLESVRQYAWERLQQSEEEEQIRGRHRAWCVALAEAAREKLRGPEQASWLQRLETEYDNCRAALGFCGEDPAGGETGLRLAAALQDFWRILGYLSEGRQHLQAVLAHADAPAADKVRASALHGAGVLAYMQGDYASAHAHFTESLTIRRELEDRPGIAYSLQGLGAVAAESGDYAQARIYHTESLAIRRELGDQPGIAQSLHSLGGVAEMQEDHDTARACFTESLAISRELGDRYFTAGCLFNLAGMAAQQGDYAQARAYHAESLAIRRELGEKSGIAASLASLGNMAATRGDYASAHANFIESLAIRRDIGDKLGIAHSLHSLGCLAEAQGDHNTACARFTESLVVARDLGNKRGIVFALESIASLASDREPERAACLYAAADAVRHAIGSPLPASGRQAYERNLAAVRLALGEEAFTAAWAEGKSKTLQQAIDYALE